MRVRGVIQREGSSTTSTSTQAIQDLASREYKYGFVTDIEQEAVPRGLNEEIVRLISAKKVEPDWLLEWRLKAYRAWLAMKEPTWGNIRYGPIDYQDIVYYAAPKRQPALQSLKDVDPEIRRTFDKLGIPLDEQKLLSGVAVDAVFDSVSVATTFKEKLASLGIIFCSFSEAVQQHPDLVRRYLGTVVPYTDNFFANTVAAAEKYDIAHEILDARQVRRRFPHFRIADDESPQFTAAG